MAARRQRRLFVWLALPLLLFFGGGESHAKTFGKAPDFRATDLEGDKVALADFLGKGPVLVDFWATWCKPCLKEMPYIQRLHEKYVEQGLTVLAVSIDSPKTQSRVKPVVRRNKFTFQVLLDPRHEVYRKLQGRGPVPYVVVLDAEGNFRYRHTGYRPGDEKKLEEIVVGLLGEGDEKPAGEADEEPVQEAGATEAAVAADAVSEEHSE